MTLDTVKLRPPLRGSLHAFIDEMAAHVREHPEVLEPDASGNVTYFKLGPYCDDSQSSRTAKTLRGYGHAHGGTVEAFPKRLGTDDYVLARFLPFEPVQLRVVDGL